MLNCFTYVFSSSFTVLNYIFRSLTQFDLIFLCTLRNGDLVSCACTHTQAHTQTHVHTHTTRTHTHTRTRTHTPFLASLTEDSVFSPIDALHELWHASEGSLLHSRGLWIIFPIGVSAIGSPQLGRKFWSEALFTSYSGNSIRVFWMFVVKHKF